MNQKTTLLVLGLTLAVTSALAVAPIINEIAYALNNEIGVFIKGTQPIRPDQQSGSGGGGSSCGDCP